MTDPNTNQILAAVELFDAYKVAYVLVGGAAIILYGSAHSKIDGIGYYEAVLKDSQQEVFGDRTIRLLSLDGIIKSKQCCKRTKDLLVLPELEMMREAEQIRKRDS